MTWHALQLAVVLVLVLVNGFFVLAEFALVKIRSTRIEQLAAAGNADAAAALGILRRLDTYLAATQLGITIASLGLGALGEPAFAVQLGPLLTRLGAGSPVVVETAAIVIAFVVITFLHLLIGELAPKYIALRNTETWVLRVSRPLRWFYRIFFPVLWLLNGAANGLLRLLRVRPSTETELAHSEEELRLIMSRSQSRGVLSLNRLLLVENAFDLGDLAVRDVMTPADRVVALDPRKPWPEILATWRQRRLSRYPLLDAGGTRYVGVIHLKDVALERLGSDQAPDWAWHRRDLFTVAPTLPVESLLREFQRRRLHLAEVRDEASGKTVGIVSLEDVLEEIVGNIEDEFEMEPSIHLGVLVRPGAVVLGLDGIDKREALRRLAEALAASRPEIDGKDLFDRVWKREEAVSTAIGDGVAVPHARLDRTGDPGVALGISRTGIPFEADGKEVVHLIFLLATPHSQPLNQVKILSRIAGMVQSDYLCVRLREAKTTEEVIEILRVADASVTL